MKNLSMIDQIKKDHNIKELNLTSPLSFGVIGELINWKFDFDVFLPTKGINLQRGLVWTLDQKRELIYTIFKEKFGSNNGVKLIPPISAVVVHVTGNIDDSIFEIIDGKQRLTTIFGFLKNEFTILINGKEFYFDEMDVGSQSVLKRYHPTISVMNSYVCEIDEFYHVTDQVKIDWFEFINYTGTPQDVEHLNALKKSITSDSVNDMKITSDLINDMKIISDLFKE